MSGLCHPHRPRRCFDAGGGILQHTIAGPFECASHAIVIEPIVMVAENSNRAGRGVETRKLDRDVFRCDEAAANDSLNDEIPEDAHHVGTRSVRAIDDLTKLRDAVERRPDMKIGEDRDSQRSSRPIERHSLL